MKIFLIIALPLALALPAMAHEGHVDAPAAPVASSPQRLPDGSVALPKPSQRQLAIRTIVTERKELPQTIELVGKVVMDPNAGGKVQPTLAGRVEPGPKGFLALGQTVRKGEVLATVKPSAGAIERANQMAQASELRANLALAEKRLARLRQLEGSVPQKDIDNARFELQSLTERLQAVGASLSSSEALTAPVSGVIAAANVVAGQVVDAREVLFEIIDPTRLRIEALAYDMQLAANIAAASASPEPGLSIPLDLIGAGRLLREQAVPIQFRLRAGQGKVPALTVGQPVKVLLQTKSLVTGVVVPATAIVRNAGNQDIVWVHGAAELFTPKTVRVMPLDGAGVSVVDGLKAGERVVVQGVALLNQVR